MNDLSTLQETLRHHTFDTPLSVSAPLEHKSGLTRKPTAINITYTPFRQNSLDHVTNTPSSPIQQQEVEFSPVNQRGTYFPQETILEDEEDKFYTLSNPTSSLPLTPFSDQVGGHTPFLRFSDKAVCKPLDPVEREFYETADERLREFQAQYLGIVNVSYGVASPGHGLGRKESWWDRTPVVVLDEVQDLNRDDLSFDDDVSSHSDREGSPHYNLELRRQVFREALSPKSLKDRFHRLRNTMGRWRRKSGEAGSLPRESGRLYDVKNNFYATDGFADFLGKMDTPSPDATPDTSESKDIFDMSDQEDKQMNPWGLQMMGKLDQHLDSGQPKQFLLLSDLTSGLGHPCILDLKMGTRQHGVNATKEKKESQEKKCETTTSKTLGVRVCGMQVYKMDTLSYTYSDKYLGRNLQAQDFKPTLKKFLDNGQRVLYDLIPGIVKKLKTLEGIVEQLNTYRFYASSLLILYDADNPTEAQIKMIDFAHSTTQTHLMRRVEDGGMEEEVGGEKVIYCRYPPTTKGPDYGYLLGVKSLVRSFEELLQEAS